jgi:mevalonate kinase
MLTISQLQFEAFQEMIPASMQGIWLEGLKSKSYALKLCGAGGGGYFIGYRLKTTPSGVLKF